MRDTCAVCGSKDLYEVLDLGIMTSANNLAAASELKEIKSFPLKYFMCKRCSLFQQLDIVSSDSLFTNYLYLTGVNKVLVSHFEKMSDELGRIVKNKGLAVVVGSNDGTEVSLLEKSGFKKAIGIEPSNIAKIASGRGIETIESFFSFDLSKELVKRYGKADLVTANNVFAHIPDPMDMLKGMGNLIADDGIISIEVHWLKSIVENLEIETLYAEHYYVWTVKAMHNLAAQVGLKIVKVVNMSDVHGGSLRFIFAKSGSEDLVLEKAEEAAGLYDFETMKGLQARAMQRKDKFVSLIKGIKAANKSIAVWSVPAKVPTLLNFCGLTSKEIDCAYEVADTKIGRYIPVANIKIRDERLIEKDKPDYLIVGAWNYMDFAVKKLDGYIKRGGKLINPLTCEIIG